MRSVLRGSLVLSLALLIGRVSGFCRELLLAARYGVSEAADAAVLILTLPDLMVGVLLSGGFNAALVPALKKKGFASRQSLLFIVGVASFGFLSVLAIAFYIWPSAVIDVFAPKLDVSAENGVVSGFRVGLIALPLSALIGVSIAYLNTVGKFSYSVLGVLVFNVTLCGFLVVPAFSEVGLFGFGVAIVVANVLRFIFQLNYMREIVLAPFRVIEPVGLGFVRLFLFGIASYALVIGVALVFRTIHAYGGDGQLASFSYAKKLFDLPSALVIAPVATIFLPLLSSEILTDPDGFERKLLVACTASWVLSFSSGLLGFQFIDFIISSIYGYGTMSTSGLASISSVAKVLVLALPAYAIFQICSVALNARLQTLRVFLSTLVSLVVGLTANYVMSIFSVENLAAYGFVIFLWCAALLTLSCLQLRPEALVDLVGRLGLSALKVSLVVLPIGMLATPAEGVSNWVPGAGFLLATCLCGLVSLSHIRPLRSIQISTT